MKLLNCRSPFAALKRKKNGLVFWKFCMKPKIDFFGREKAHFLKIQEYVKPKDALSLYYHAISCTCGLWKKTLKMGYEWQNFLSSDDMKSFITFRRNWLKEVNKYPIKFKSFLLKIKLNILIGWIMFLWQWK